MNGPAIPFEGGPLQPRITHAGPLASIALHGELDLGSVADLERLTALAADLPGVETLVVDLCDVEFADSSTMARLMRSRDRLARMGIALVVLAAGPVLTLLRLTGVCDLLRVVPEHGCADRGALVA
jgi:anti-anti-sigma factor